MNIEQVHYIWKGKWTTGRILFLLLRYTTIVQIILSTTASLTDGPSEAFCQFDYFYCGYSIVATQAIFSTILILRLSALYQGRPLFRRTLFAILGLEIVVAIVMVGLTTVRLRPTRDSVAVLVCMPGDWPQYAWACWVPATAMESLLFLLALGKSVEVLLSRDAYKPELLVLLLRDSMLCYGAVLAALVPNLVLWICARPTIRDILTGSVPVLQTVIGTRVLLNIYEAAEAKVELRWIENDDPIFVLEMSYQDQHAV